MGRETSDPERERAEYDVLVSLLHPGGLACPRCGARGGLGVHRRHRDPVLDYQCAGCGRVFNAWSGTELEGTHRPPTEIVAILEGVARDVPTARLARQIGCQRPPLDRLRRRLRGLSRAWGARPSGGAGAAGPTGDPEPRLMLQIYAGTSF